MLIVNFIAKTGVKQDVIEVAFDDVTAINTIRIRQENIKKMSLFYVKGNDKKCIQVKNISINICILNTCTYINI